jgi:rod shape-determining protein MreB and related proteins
MKLGFFKKIIGIDLGTANVIVYVKDKGVIANEPSVVAVTQSNKILAVGERAKSMIGRTPDDIVAYRPLQNGVIADYRVTLAMLRYFIRKAQGPFWFSKPEVMISIPVGATSTERKAVIDAATESGASRVYLIKEPLAAAIGAGLPVAESVGSMIVNIGGGTSEIATISLGNTISAMSLRVAGDSFDESITTYLRKNYNLAVGEQTAEKIKIDIASAIELPEEEVLKMAIKGRDLITGLPKSIEIDSNEMASALKDSIESIAASVKDVLEDTKPEVVADIFDSGIYLTGGSGQLRNLDKFIAQETRLPVFVAKDAQFCVAKGTGIALGSLDLFKRSDK